MPQGQPDLKSSEPKQIALLYRFDMKSTCKHSLCLCEHVNYSMRTSLYLALLVTIAAVCSSYLNSFLQVQYDVYFELHSSDIEYAKNDPMDNKGLQTISLSLPNHIGDQNKKKDAEVRKRKNKGIQCRLKVS
uniref:Uncharacterized protein n=1 Tax=Glossina palpalis gambiensis TaxID=67801 RepID=A0A1B0BMB8_9MUSC